MAELRNLPTFVVLKATHGTAPFKYLGVVNDGSEYQNYVAYSTDKVVSEQAKFAIEFAASGGVAHIRSCYNNKYLVRSSAEENWIVATAKEPVEDQTSWNCTLFRPIINGDTVKFVHVQLGKTVGRRDSAPDRSMYLCLEPLATTDVVSQVVDYGSLVILPPVLTFKSKQNGKYLFNDIQALHFASESVGGNLNFSKVFYTDDGLIYLRPDRINNKDNIWGFNPNPLPIPLIPGDAITAIKVYQGTNPTEPDMFKIFKVDKNTIALRHIINNKLLEVLVKERKKMSGKVGNVKRPTWEKHVLHSLFIFGHLKEIFV